MYRSDVMSRIMQDADFLEQLFATQGRYDDLFWGNTASCVTRSNQTGDDLPMQIALESASAI